MLFHATGDGEIVRGDTLTLSGDADFTLWHTQLIGDEIVYPGDKCGNPSSTWSCAGEAHGYVGPWNHVSLVQVREASVIIAVSSPHRKEAQKLMILISE